MSRLPIHLLTILLVCCFSTSVLAQTDLTHHPLYSKYQFGKNQKVVDFGAQPLAVPVGVIAEVMKRDRILRSELNKRGWEIRFHRFLKGSDINFFVERGEIDAAMVGDMPTIQFAASHDITVAALAKKGFVGFVSNRYLRIEELKGKRIGYTPASNAHYALLVTLKAAGLRETDVVLTPMNVNEMADALAGNAIDVFCAWEPVPTAALSKHRNFKIIQKVSTPTYLFFDRIFAQGNPDIAELLMASYIRSLRWMKADDKNLMKAAGWTLKEAGLLLGKPYNPSAEDVARITNEDILKLSSSPAVPANDLKKGGLVYRSFLFLQGQGKIAGNVPWEKIHKSFDNSLLLKILKNPAEYRLREFNYDE